MIKLLEHFITFKCKHQFYDPKNKPMSKHAPRWFGYKCRFCEKISGLDAWQIRDMPREMAVCEKSDVWIGNWEWFTQSINCFDRYQ